MGSYVGWDIRMHSTKCGMVAKHVLMAPGWRCYDWCLYVCVSHCES